jgi:hypothetical protein
MVARSWKEGNNNTSHNHLSGEEAEEIGWTRYFRVFEILCDFIYKVDGYLIYYICILKFKFIFFVSF